MVLGGVGDPGKFVAETVAVSKLLRDMLHVTNSIVIRIFISRPSSAWEAQNGLYSIKNNLI